MRGIAVVIACLGCCAIAVGCESLVGITGKTLVGASADSGGEEDSGSHADGPAGADGAPDASVPCTQQAQPYIFCEDFDHETDAGESFTYELIEGGASLQLDPTTYKTPPQSATVTIPQQALAQLGLKPPMNLKSGFSLGFDLFVGASTTGTVSLAGIPQVGIAQVFSNPYAKPEFNYILGPGSSCELDIYSQSGMKSVVSLPTPPLQKWTRITLVYDATQGTSVIEDGVTIGTSGEAVGAPGSISMIVGAPYSNAPGAPLTFEIDDVVLRGQ